MVFIFAALYTELLNGPVNCRTEMRSWPERGLALRGRMA